LSSSTINRRAVVVLALGVATTIVLLAIVPKHAPSGDGQDVAAGATPTTTPATTTTSDGGGGGNATAPTTTTFPVAGRPQLRLGATGPDVVALQQKLTELGYSTGTADGNFGASTETAVMNFQQAKNLQADGVVGDTTWAALAAG
jgi:peptidoglycan hydrolase-like protein with peptidoglycan-binding domain